MATLALEREACLPAAVLVDKHTFLRSPQQVALDALQKLADVRPNRGGDPSPSVVNAGGVKKGVVKVGWSWEAQFVFDFYGEARLAERLREMLTCEGCSTSTCIVQEWVDFDFEMRFFFFPPEDWTPAVALSPKRIEYNVWGAWDDDEGKPGCLGWGRGCSRIRRAAVYQHITVSAGLDLQSAPRGCANDTLGFYDKAY